MPKTVAAVKRTLMTAAKPKAPFKAKRKVNEHTDPGKREAHRLFAHQLRSDGRAGDFVLPNVDVAECRRKSRVDPVDFIDCQLARPQQKHVFSRLRSVFDALNRRIVHP